MKPYTVVAGNPAKPVKGRRKLAGGPEVDRHCEDIQEQNGEFCPTGLFDVNKNPTPSPPPPNAIREGMSVISSSFTNLWVVFDRCHACPVAQ